MAMRTVIAPLPEPGAGAVPTVLFVEGNAQRSIRLERLPFTVGRKVDRDLVISDPRVSREHAIILLQDGAFYVADQGSKHGTFVNGERVERRRLQPNDRIEFGVRDVVYMIFAPSQDEHNTAREFLSQISEIQLSTDSTDLEKLTLFLEAARKLNTSGVLDEILVTLIDTTLRLTRAERGYIFLRDEHGKLRLAAGRNARGEPLLDDTTISHSILDEALNSASEFLVTDTSQSSDLAARNSIVAYDLRTVVCMPLRKPQVQSIRETSTGSAAEIMGALYVDARYASRDFSSVSHDILRAIATEAASLVENARLVQAEEAARRYQQELSIAASMQQRLMAVTIPDVPFAKLRGKNLSCKEVGGDFFDAVASDDELAVVLADVAGKGIPAALLANTLQGMICSHLSAAMPLVEIVTQVNRYFCRKHLGEKYATVVIVRLRRDGELEYVNCGHIPPLLLSHNQVSRPERGNLPVGLLPDAVYEGGHCRLQPGDRLLLVTDGVTEAENASGEMFESERLESVAARSSSLDDVFAAINSFCNGVPLNDDCTAVELVYSGATGPAAPSHS